MPADRSASVSKASMRLMTFSNLGAVRIIDIYDNRHLQNRNNKYQDFENMSTWYITIYYMISSWLSDTSNNGLNVDWKVSILGAWASKNDPIFKVQFVTSLVKHHGFHTCFFFNRSMIFPQVFSSLLVVFFCCSFGNINITQYLPFDDQPLRCWGATRWMLGKPGGWLNLEVSSGLNSLTRSSYGKSQETMGNTISYWLWY